MMPLLNCYLFVGTLLMTPGQCYTLKSYIFFVYLVCYCACFKLLVNLLDMKCNLLLSKEQWCYQCLFCCVQQLCLPTGVPVEVIVCSVVTPNHVFLQQPTHPTFPSLERQNYHMRMCYSVENVPHLPRPIDGTVSAVRLTCPYVFILLQALALLLVKELLMQV